MFELRAISLKPVSRWVYLFTQILGWNTKNASVGGGVLHRLMNIRLWNCICCWQYTRCTVTQYPKVCLSFFSPIQNTASLEYYWSNSILELWVSDTHYTSAYTCMQPNTICTRNADLAPTLETDSFKGGSALTHLWLAAIMIVHIGSALVITYTNYVWHFFSKTFETPSFQFSKHKKSFCVGYRGILFMCGSVVQTQRYSSCQVKR